MSTGLTRLNYASHHLVCAREAALRIRAVEAANVGAGHGPHFDQIMFDSGTAVIMAVAALDAFIGEIQFEPTQSFPNQQPAFVKACIGVMDRKPTMERIDFLSLLAGVAPAAAGKEPRQSVNALIHLRNNLVHHKPEWLGDQDEHGKLGDRIRAYVKRSPLQPAAEPLFPRGWMSYGSAKWAVESARAFMIERMQATGWRCDALLEGERYALP